MRYSAMTIANAFIKNAKQEKDHNLTPMKLQKLMFFTQSWYLKTHDEILFSGYFERWQYGPVLPEIYHEFKMYGSNNIESFGNDWFGVSVATDALDDATIKFIEQINEVYGIYSGTELSWMTHQPETAWSKGQPGTIINVQDMLDGRV